MAEESDLERSEPASQRRLDQARERGEVPRSPELSTFSVLLAAGAYDAWATPIVMKKGRPAFTVHALCEPSATSAIAELLLSETGSLGIRGTVLERWPQRRSTITVEVEGHPIGVKLATGRVKVEHDDAVAAATALGWPLRAVFAAAEALAWASRTD